MLAAVWKFFVLENLRSNSNRGLLEMGIQAEQARADMEGALESAQSEVKQLVNLSLSLTTLHLMSYYISLLLYGYL